MYLASTTSLSAMPADTTIPPASILEKSAPVLSNFLTTSGWKSRGYLQSNLSDVCALLDISAPENAEQENILFQHVHYKAGKKIHTMGQQFDTLFIINSGFLKKVLIDESGNEQVLGFPMKGDLLGIDAIHSKHHVSELVALSDCDLILLPYQTFIALGRTYAELEQAMFGVMSREIVREQITIGMLSALGAEAKVARFLTNLGERFSQMGYSGKVYNLRMTRLEIASYLGLAIETVSRTLSALHELGLIVVYQRQINIIDAVALASLRKLPQNKLHSSVSDTNPPGLNEKKEATKTSQTDKKHSLLWEKEMTAITF